VERPSLLHGLPYRPYGADRASGRYGVDNLFGDAGGGYLNGGNADYTLTDGTGSDTINGGPDDTVFAADGELDSINCGLSEGDVAFVDQADLDAEGTNMQDFIRLTSCEKINEPVIEEPPVETPALGPETGRRGRAGSRKNRPSLFTLSWRLGSWWGSSSTRAAGAGTR